MTVASDAQSRRRVCAISILIPLRGEGRLRNLEKMSPWEAGPWTYPGTSGRHFVAKERTWHYLMTEPADRINCPDDRFHWVNPSLRGFDFIDCLELVHAPTDLSSKAPSAYLIVHTSITPGPKGGITEIFERITNLYSPRRGSTSALLETAALESFKPDLQYPRATTVSLVIDAGGLPPFKGDNTMEDAVAFLANLPNTTPLGQRATLHEIRPIGPRSLMAVSAGGVSLSLADHRDSLGEMRAFVVDALLIATIQRDQLVGFSLEWANKRERKGRSGNSIADRFDKFRRIWWWAAPLSHQSSYISLPYETWQSATRSQEFMNQLSDEFRDARNAQQAKATRLLAYMGLGIAVVSIIVALIVPVVFK